LSVDAADEEKKGGVAAQRSSGLRTNAWWTLGVLTVVAVLDHADRALTGAIVEPLKAEFELSDSEIGFLMGFAFVLLRMIIGVPVGRLADTWNRRNLLAIAISVWSVATLTMGMARSFVELIVTRFMVGAGTSGSWPPALSMVSDLFPIQRRGLAMGIWNIGTVIGFSVGLGGAAIIVDNYGWRAALMSFGAAGILIAAFLLIAIREPLRRNASGDSVEEHEPPSFRSVISLIFSQRSLCHVIVGSSLLIMVDVAIGSWGISFFVRSHELSIASAGSLTAIVFVAGGIPGTFLGGYLIDRLEKRDRRWHVWSPMLAALVAVPVGLAFLLAPSTAAALVGMFVFSLIQALWYAPQTTLGTGLVTSRARAMTWAIFGICLLVFGQGLGPQIVGVLSDLFLDSMGQHSLRYALAAIIGLQVWAAAHFFFAARTLRADYERVAER
jgi:MFS family permease